MQIILLFFLLLIEKGHSEGIQPLAPPQKPDLVGQALQTHFIWVPITAKPNSGFIAFRKSFLLSSLPSKAQLHLFADRRYLLWINGQYLLRGPVRFVPNGPEYDSMDVTSTLHSGQNEIVVLVLGLGSNGKMMNHQPGLSVLLDAYLGSSEKFEMTTDETWKWSDHTRYRTPHIDWSGVFDQIDSTQEDGDWIRADYDDSKWSPAEKVEETSWGPLSARRIPLLRSTPLNPQLDPGITFPVSLNAGQQLNFTLPHGVQAYTVLDCEAEAGTVFELPYAKIHYVAKAGPQTYISSDTCAFKDGTIKVISGHLVIHSFTPVEWLYPFDVSGSFTCNDDQLNRLWALCIRSDQFLSEDAYDDCADRERVEWMDCDPPAFDVTRVAMSGPGEDGQKVYADSRLLKEMLRRTAQTLQPEGWVKAHTCSDRFDIHAKMEDRACDWVEGARRYYESTGDEQLIQEIWPAIRTQLQWFLDKRTARGLVLAREWIIWGNPLGYQTCEGLGLNAFVDKALVDGAFLGNSIGEKEDAETFAQAAHDLSTAINTVLWDEKEGTYYSAYYEDFAASQAVPKARHLSLKCSDNHLIEPNVQGTLFALDQGIVPPEHLNRVTQYFLSQNRDKARIMFYYYAFKELYAQNDPTLDQEVLTRMRTQWAKMLSNDWGCSLEDFGGGSSKAHCYGMYPAYFLSSYVLGVRWQDGVPIRRQLLIEPHLGDLTQASGTVVTEAGPIPISWKKEEHKLSFSFAIPDNLFTTLRVPYTGTIPAVKIDGQVITPHTQGGYLEMKVTTGNHEGSVTY